MKTGKTLRRLAAAVLAGTMMLAMSTSAFAAGVTTPDSDGNTQVTLTKTVTAETNVKAPNTSFTFAITTGSAAIKTEDDKNVVVYAGVQGGAYFADGANTITFAPDDSLTKTTNVSIDVSKFPTPGVYRYVVTESEETYDGITYDDASYYMDVYVINNGTNGKTIQAVTTSKITIEDDVETSAKSDLTFTNIYTTNNLTLRKVVDGNQADMSKKFSFTIQVDGAAGEEYATSMTGVVLTSGTEATVNLGNNETITVYGLSANDTYTIVESSYASDGYETTITGADETTGLTATGKVADADDTVVYTNTKKVTTPTGIITNVLPYVLMVAAAAALVFVFLRKREYDR